MSDKFNTGVSGHSNRVFCCKFHPTDSNICVTAGWDSNIIIHDMRQKGPVGGIYGPMIVGDGIAFDGNNILTSSWRTTEQLQLWDWKTHKLFKNVTWEHPSLERENVPMLFTCSRRYYEAAGTYYSIAAGSNMNECRVFDKNYEPQASIVELSRSVFSCDISMDGEIFLTAGGDGIIRVFRTFIN